jgi:hypothetical protein
VPDVERRRGNGAGHGGPASGLPARGYSWPPFEKGNTAALVHGATSERTVAPLARNYRRRMLRRLRLSPGDLDSVGKGYLDLYCRTAAKLDLLDAYFAEHGLLKEDGDPQPATRLYVQLVTATRTSLVRLEDHLRSRDPRAAGIESLILEGRAIRERNGDDGEGEP